FPQGSCAATWSSLAPLVLGLSFPPLDFLIHGLPNEIGAGFTVTNKLVHALYRLHGKQHVQILGLFEKLTARHLPLYSRVLTSGQSQIISVHFSPVDKFPFPAIKYRYNVQECNKGKEGGEQPKADPAL